MDYYSEIREFLESNGDFWAFEDYPLWSETNKFETIEVHEIFIDDDDDLSISYYDDSSMAKTMKVNNLLYPDDFLEKAYYLI